tara:strand:+ start:210 stop:2018 length:1809 start_codon:yes stop_codon:yes gene_type:complete
MIMATANPFAIDTVPDGLQTYGSISELNAAIKAQKQADINKKEHDKIKRLQQVGKDLLDRAPGDEFYKWFGGQYDTLISEGLSPDDAIGVISKDVARSSEAKSVAAVENAPEAVTSSFQNLLGRLPGTEGAQYWTETYQTLKDNAIASGMSEAEAEAAATQTVRQDIGRSTEAFDYIRGESDLATTEYDPTAMGIPDWFQFQDENVEVGTRPEDWAANLNTSNLENYLEEQNYQYGVQQGNVVGQEGNEWWGYQQTQDIQSYLAEGYDFATAQSMARENIARDIGMNTGAINYEKFGTIGYGNPLEIKTSTDPSGDILTEKVYLDLDPATNLNPTGTKTATQYQIDEEGEYVLDDDGNLIATGETATPYSWEYVPDSTKPGGFEIRPVPFDYGDGLSTVGQEHYMANYELDGASPGGGGRLGFDVEYPVTNVAASQFTLDADDPNKLNLAQWAETPAGKAAIEAGNFDIKNKWMEDTDGDGLLDYEESTIDHETSDSNLGLGIGETLDLDLGGGYQVNLSGPEDPITKRYVPPVSEQQQMTGGAGYGGGKTIINLDTNQKSTTAANKALKIEDRAIASGQGRRGFSTSKYKSKGNIRQLGIV